MADQSPDAFVVFGDWRDLRGAIERSHPEWSRLSEDGRTKMWSFAEGLLKEYSPLKFRCSGCKQVKQLSESYRCADCHAPLCRSCIIPHFGPNHRRHA